MLLLILLKSRHSLMPFLLLISDHLSRISNPEIKAPWAISLAMLFTYLAGFLFNIVLCFCMVQPPFPLSFLRRTKLTIFRATRVRS
jgi:hypothetical protein